MVLRINPEMLSKANMNVLIRFIRVDDKILKFITYIIYDFVYMNALPEHMYVHCMHTRCLRMPEENIGSPGTGVTIGCQPPYGCLEPNLNLLQG